MSLSVQYTGLQNSDEKAFISKYARLLQQLDSLKKNGKHVIICTDHNFDFLKSDTHIKMRELVEINVDNHMWPVITKPTRITKKSATLIDNIIVSNSTYNDYECDIILDDLSDHLPCYLVSKNLKLRRKEPLVITSRKLTPKNIS